MHCVLLFSHTGAAAGQRLFILMEDIMAFEDVKEMFRDQIPWVKYGELSLELIEEGHVILKIPKEKHLNHVGIIYAGSLFMLMEIAGAALIGSKYPPKTYVPINKGMSIEFKKPGTTDMFCELWLNKEDDAKYMKTVEEKGKSDYFMDMEAKDANGVVCATSRCNYYVKKFDKPYERKVK